MTGMVRRAVVAAAVAAILAGCTTTTTFVGEPVIVGADAPAPFPECQAEAFAFVGEASLAAIGLESLAGGGPDANRVGRVWVTAGPGRMDMGPGAPPSGQRVLCIEWPDGSGMSTTIDDGWLPPGVEAVETTTTSPAWPVIGVAAVVVLLLGVSFLAFRRE